jgi:hypothetical protein
MRNSIVFVPPLAAVVSAAVIPLWMANSTAPFSPVVNGSAAPLPRGTILPAGIISPEVLDLAGPVPPMIGSEGDIHRRDGIADAIWDAGARIVDGAKKVGKVIADNVPPSQVAFDNCVNNCYGTCMAVWNSQQDWGELSKTPGFPDRTKECVSKIGHDSCQWTCTQECKVKLHVPWDGWVHERPVSGVRVVHVNKLYC